MKFSTKRIKRTINFYLARTTAVGIAVLLFAVEAAARAGGGGGGGGFSSGGYSSSRSYSSSGGPDNPLVFIAILGGFAFIFFCFWLHSTYKLRKNKRDAERIIRELTEIDRSWNPKFIGERLNKIYFAVQKAWMERDQDLAKEYMSQRLYDEHKEQTEIMKIKHEKNILKNIRLLGFKIVEVKDYKEDSKDQLWVEIHGAIKDSTIDDRTEEVIKCEPSEQFKELWLLIRGETGWVLHEIDPSVTTEDFVSMNSMSEAL